MELTPFSTRDLYHFGFRSRTTSMSWAFFAIRQLLPEMVASQDSARS